MARAICIPQPIHRLRIRLCRHHLVFLMHIRHWPRHVWCFAVGKENFLIGQTIYHSVASHRECALGGALIANIIFFLHIALLALRCAVGCATFGAFIHFKSEKLL